MTAVEAQPLTLSRVLELARRNRIAIAIIMVVSIATAVVLAFVLPPSYRGTVLLAPSRNTDDQSLLKRGGVGALSLLSGLQGQQGNPTMEAIAVLRSRPFLERFIKRHDLLPILFADKWDAQRKQWKGKPPSLEDGYLEMRSSVLNVQVDDETGFVKLQVDAGTAERAANWANQLVTELNDEIRERVVKESTADLEFLTARMREANETELRSSISNLIRDRMKEIMLATNRENYVFRVLEAALPSKYRQFPRKVVMLGAGIVVGVLLCFAFVATRESIAQARR